MPKLKISVFLILLALVASGCADLGTVNPIALAIKPFHANRDSSVHQNGNLLIVITYGLGCSADGPGNGLRSMSERIRSRYPGDQVITRAWDDHDNVEQTIQNHQGPVALIGHSFGGSKSLELAEHAQRSIDWLILLDPVPYNDWGIRHSGQHFTVPPSVVTSVCFYRPAGIWPLSYPILNPISASDNHLLEIGHNDFCKHPQVEQCIMNLCAQAAESGGGATALSSLSGS